MSRKTTVWVRAAACAMAAGLVLAGCAKKENVGSGDNQGGGGGQPSQPSAGWPETPEVQIQPGKPGGIFRLGITEPTAIDPYNAQESEGILVAQYLFTGLVKVEPNGDVKPAAAEKWEPNADCSEWTFDITPGKFTNGEDVNAEAFKRSWTRSALKSAASEVSYHLAPIQGYKELQDGTASEFTGVDASNPSSLKVKLAENDCEFYLRTYHPVYAPVPSTAGAADNKAYNDQPIGNGLFKLDGPWQHDRGIRLVRNDDYSYGQKAYLDAVEITITPNGSKDEYDGFKNGTFDWARMPVPQLTEARSTYEPKGSWIRKNTNGMNYLLVMVTQKPLDTPKARKAVSMAIDRKAIIDGVFKGSQIQSRSIVPPAFPKAYQPDVCNACDYNLDEAKKLAGEAGLTEGTAMNMQFNVDAGHDEWMAAVKQQLEKNLGLKINMTGVQFKDLLNNEQQVGSSGLYRAAWGADYPTPGNFLAPLLSTEAIGAPADKPTTGDNRGRYSNSQFDDLLKRARESKDENERNNLYKQAEKIAIGDDLALMPLWLRTQNRLGNSDKFINLRMDFNEFPDFSVISIK